LAGALPDVRPQVWLLVVLALLYMAPVWTLFNLFLLYIVWLYVKSEDNRIHHAQEHENRFWTGGGWGRLRLRWGGECLMPD
jgi:heme/copper-type cytochrome/quinol oxidase subunit 2